MKKGFTLIELLAVIVILGVLTLISIPIVSDITKKSKIKTNEVSVKNYIRSVEQSLYLHNMGEDVLSDGIYNITTDGKICINSNCTKLLNVDIDGEKPSGGKIKIENNKVIFISNLKYSRFYGYYENETVMISNSVKNPTCVISIDEDKDNVADTGDMITCGSEKFYVIKNNSTTIDLLTEKNITLSTTEPRQSDDVKTISFVSSFAGYYWQEFDPYGFATGYPLDGKDFVYDSNSTLYPYIEAYENYLIGIGVSSVAATLISTSQLEKLGCSTTSCSSSYEWVYSISYWTGSTPIDRDTSIYYVNSSGYLSGYSGSAYETYGIRPVITILTSELG